MRADASGRGVVMGFEAPAVPESPRLTRSHVQD